MQSPLFETDEAPASTYKAEAKHYQVLARKYRPSTFADMIGQEVLVTTMRNALQTGRIAHAFVLTGIRGVGKTTTARIIARALNCIGADNTLQQPTIEPCGVCVNCTAIADDRHQDVLEIDAASHTGVGDIRELIENARYGPLSSRYKVYIIDEVHMLSNNAFNALLKTLEEPPAHVKFIFATTEIRKIPVTILSRCQRFDLKRVSVEELSNHYKRILEQEGYSAEDSAVRIIAAAASGSVRDGLSILDQAIASNEGTLLTEATVRALLGLVDYNQVYALFHEVSTGNIAAALALTEKLHINGADPVLLIQDLLEVVHRISRIKAAGAGALPQSTEQELISAKELADTLPTSYLARTWQMLLRGYEEVRSAVQPMAALEMVLIRIAYCSTMPSLESLVAGNDMPSTIPSPAVSTQPLEPIAVNINVAPQESKEGDIVTLQDIANLCLANHEMILYHQVMSEIYPIDIAHGHIKLGLLPSAPKTLVIALRDFLQKITGQNWAIEILPSDTDGIQPTLHQQVEVRSAAAKEQLREHPLVHDILKTINGLEIAQVNTA